VSLTIAPFSNERNKTRTTGVQKIVRLYDV
jgi:hypothetical protein